MNIYELEAAPLLLPGQNLYAQPPFEKILADAAGSNSVNIEDLRHILSSQCVSFKHSYEHREWQNIPNPDFTLAERLKTGQLPTSPGETLARLHGSREGYTRYYPALQHIGREIQEYPYWYSYLAPKIPADYDHSGQRKQWSKPSESYAAWVTRKLARDHRAMLREVFPSYFDQENVLAAVRPGLPTGSRRWRIMSASNLTY